MPVAMPKAPPAAPTVIAFFERRTRLREANCALQTSRRVARLLFRIMVLYMFVLLRAFLHYHLALLRASPFTE